MKRSEKEEMIKDYRDKGYIRVGFKPIVQTRKSI